MSEISETQSLCSGCLEPIRAMIVETDEGVFMRKECPRHGPQEVLISSDADWYRRAMAVSPKVADPTRKSRASAEGCPWDCGYCDAHRQRMYLPVVPITSACNLNCPVCYTINRRGDAYLMTREEFAVLLERIREQDPEMQIINFTGGEPLLHPELCDFVRMCREAGIHRVTISTNGLAFLNDEGLLARLTELGARIVFSLNSFEEAPYVRMSGVSLLTAKLRILEQLERWRPSTTLLTVAAAGINDRELGEIVRYVLDADFVVSSEIHTVAFTGQSMAGFDRSTRLTTPDVIAAIVAGNGSIRKEDFLPSPCAHPLCYQTCYLLKLGNGETAPLSSFIPEEGLLSMLSGSLYLQPSQITEEVLRDALNDLWSKASRTQRDERILAALRDLIRRMYPPQALDPAQRQEVAERATKAIYIHSHMDAANFDLARIANCCVAVPEKDGSCIPTCAYNLVYRARDPRFCETVT